MTILSTGLGFQLKAWQSQHQHKSLGKTEKLWVKQAAKCQHLLFKEKGWTVIADSPQKAVVARRLLSRGGAHFAQIP